MHGSTPFPNEWMHNNVERFNLKDKLNEDFSNTIWGGILIQYFEEIVVDNLNSLKSIAQNLKEDSSLNKYYLAVNEDINILEKLTSTKQFKWDEICEKFSQIVFEKNWPKERNIESELKEKSKKVRDEVRKEIGNLKKDFFTFFSKDVNKDMYKMYQILTVLERIIILFSIKYNEKKKEKNILDFNDIEHFALEILVEKNEEGKYVATEIAKQYREKFKEIAIDEYQDSNLVQEYILSTISNGKNMFMVGDVKQSIYKFRQTRPELFWEKYNTYTLAKNDDGICIEDTKIQLFQNFRSRKNVLDITNLIFKNIMSKKLGDIEYNEEEYLNLGLEYPEAHKDTKIFEKAELDIINLEDENNKDEHYDSQNDDDENYDSQNNDDKYEEIQDETIVTNIEIEAKFVANKMKQLLKDNYYIYDKKSGYRKVTFKDIVILLRKTSNVANLYEKALEENEIPVFSDIGSNYLESTEIQTIISLLKIIDNPNNDIPLVTVLRSQIGGFTDNDLIEVRLENKEYSFYEALLNTAKYSDNIKLKEKINLFFDILKELQIKQEYLSLDELIWYTYEKTGYYDFINSNPNGEAKTANLRLLFEKAKDYEKASFKGLYNFIKYIERINEFSKDSNSAKLLGENDNVVRIMSIHKSKGLEFPIVFLCGTGKQFNMQDLNLNILLNQDLGFGPKYIDYDKKIKYDTLAKEAIKIKQKNEILSEEMRLLYVALTRAKEKLIITGIDKNYKKSLEKKEKDLSINNNREKISEIVVKKAMSYLDWLELVILNNKDQNIIETNIYSKNINNGEENISQNDNNFIIKENENINEEIDKLLKWKYKYLELSNLEGKTSVSKISKEEKNKMLDIVNSPKFMEKTTKLTSSQIGTLMHLILQKLDFKEEYNIQKLKDLINKLVSLSIITDEEAVNINTNKILEFTQSEMFNRIKEAKKVYKEQPFYITLTADEVYNNKSQEKILIQGIIDLYFIDKNDDIVLLDYKTDYIEPNNENVLIDRYSNQLNLYKRAIEQATNKKVNNIYIYSMCLNKEIEIKQK